MSIVCAGQILACGGRTGAVQSSASSKVSDSITGTWRVTRFATGSRTDTITRFPFGVSLRGYLVYDATGHMLFQVDRPTAIDSLRVEIAHGNAGSVLKLMDGFATRYGTYVVNLEQRTITHHVEGEMPPRSGRFELATPFRVSRDSLVLGDDSASAWHFARVRG